MRKMVVFTLKVVAVAVVAGALLVGGVFVGSARAASNTPTISASYSQTIVNKYLSILNSGMSTPQCDFSKMATIYTSNARITASGGPFAPGGPFGPGNAEGAQTFQGTAKIIGFYTKLCHVIYSGVGAGPAWSQDASYLLYPNVLNSYEHVSAGGKLLGRCMHVFTISGDRLSSLDWSVYA